MQLYRVTEKLLTGDSMPAKFCFYEVVEIQSERPSLAKVTGLSGAILGMAKNDNGDWSYSVHVFDLCESWVVREPELIHTGKFMNREDFYSGESLIVQVDKKTGEGQIKP